MGNSFDFSSAFPFQGDRICPEFQIIPRPGSLNQYIVIFTPFDVHHLYSNSHYFIVSVNENTGEFDVEIPVPSDFKGDGTGFSAFCPIRRSK